MIKVISENEETKMTSPMAAVLKKRQILVFLVGWLAYASTYFLRKPLGVIKTDLMENIHLDKVQLGWLDMGLLLPYAFMQMLLGPVGDKFGPRRTFGICLLMSGLSMATFGQWSNFYILFALLFLNGTAQAQCWPNCMKSLGSWYPDSVRNSVFGMFGTCAFAGGIIGTSLAVYLQTSYGWRSVFLPPSVIVIFMGLVVLLLYHQPDEIGIEVPGKEQNVSSSKSGTKLSMMQLWRIPVVPEVAVAMFCLKVVRYCMYMWLPLYLLNELKYSKGKAGMFSTVFEIGGVLGSAGIGFIMDRYFKGRALLGTGFSVFLSALALLCFLFTSSWGIIINCLFLFIAGAFNCGPDSILGGAVPAELGELEGRNAAAATVGIVNGFGSVGTVLEGPIIGIVSSQYGFSGMFVLMIILSFIGTVSVFRGASIYNSKVVRKIPEAEALDPDIV